MYCDFYSITERENSIDKFVDAITKEIERCAVDVSQWVFDTIFIGGGTPSLLNGRQIEKIISALYKKYDLSHIIEFTIGFSLIVNVNLLLLNSIDILEKKLVS